VAEREPASGSARSSAESESRRSAPSLAGNLAVGRLLAASIRTKTAVTHPGDPEEEEADRVADAVSNGTAAPTIRRDSRTVCAKAEHAGSTPGAAKLDRAVAAVSGGGHTLPRDARRTLEPKLRHDLTDVRIHTDAIAGSAARDIGARAYALGSHVAFAPGEFRPFDRDGQRLLVHELTHTLQQTSRYAPARVPTGDGPLSRDMDRVARQAAPVTIAPDPTNTPAPDRTFTIATLPDEPDLFAVPDDASRQEVAKRLLGDASGEASVQFVATAKIPVLEHKPAKAVRITNPAALTPAALTVLQTSLDAQLDTDVATVVGILKQKLIGDADESGRSGQTSRTRPARTTLPPTSSGSRGSRSPRRSWVSKFGRRPPSIGCSSRRRTKWSRSARPLSCEHRSTRRATR
jgi:hypothetical protein